MRRALQISDGDWLSLFKEPVAIGTYILILAILLTPLVMRILHRTPPDPIHVNIDDLEKKRRHHGDRCRIHS